MTTTNKNDLDTPEQSDMQTAFAFDSIWEKIPHISCYQWKLLILVGMMGFQGAFMAIYPVFAQYKPPVRCETIFDTQKEFRWSVQKQFLRRCNPLKNLIQNIFIVSLLLIKLKILQQGLRFVRTLEKMMTRNVIFVTWLFLMIVRR